MKKVLKIVAGVLALVLAAGGGFAAFVHFAGIPSYAPGKVDLRVEITPQRVERGKTLSNMLCKECHFDPATGRLTGRKMLDLPPEFGTAYSKNITADPTHGIGKWTDGEIASLLRTGLLPDGRYTPPWMVKLPRIADEDIHSIIAYLRSGDSLVAPHPAPDRESEPSFLVKFLTRVAFKPFPYPEAPVKAPDISDKLAFGKYLVQGVADCYGCHSANFKTNNDVFPEKSKGYLGGGNPMLGLDGEFIYTANITSDAETGIGNWSEEDFIRTMQSGIRPDGRPMRYPMVRTPEFTEQELSALYAYLRSAPPIRNAVARNFQEPDMAAKGGKDLYRKYACNSCHGESGAGVADLTRANANFPADSQLVAWIKNPPVHRPMTKMPAYEGLIKEEEYAPLVAYVRELGR